MSCELNRENFSGEINYCKTDEHRSNPNQGSAERVAMSYHQFPRFYISFFGFGDDGKFSCGDSENCCNEEMADLMYNRSGEKKD